MSSIVNIFTGPVAGWSLVALVFVILLFMVRRLFIFYTGLKRAKKLKADLDKALEISDQKVKELMEKVRELKMPAKREGNK